MRHLGNNGVILHLSEQVVGINRSLSRRTQLPSAGQVISAVVVSEMEGRLTLEASNGFVFQADAHSLRAGVGDLLRFEVMENSGEGSLRLRNIDNKEAVGRRTTEAMQVTSLRELLRAGGIYSDARDIQSEEAEHLNKLRAIAAIRRQVASGRSLAPQVVAQLANYGLSLEKLGFDSLLSIMTDIGVRQAVSLAEEDAVRTVEEYKSGPDANFSKHDVLLHALSKRGVSLTNENIASATHALETFASSALITEASMVHLLRDDQPLSVSNIYSASFSTSYPPVSHQNNETLERLIPALQDFFEHMHIPNTPENRELALFMISHDLDITPQSLDRLSLLYTIASPTAQEEVADRIAYAMSLGKNPLTAALDAPTPVQNASEILAYYDELRNNFPDISSIPDDRLELAVNSLEGEPLSLRHIRSILHVHNTIGLPSPTTYTTPQTDVKQVRLTLEQIRIKLSFEAAQMLSAKGINIDTMPLFEALNNVRQAQAEALSTTPSLPLHYTATESAIPLHEPLTSKEVGLLVRTADAIFQMRPPGPITLGGLALRRYEGRITSNGALATPPSDAPHLTISSIAAKVAQERLESGYEQFQTTINPRLGDSFSKVRDQFVPLLLGLDIKPSAPNVAAAEILTKNGLDITPESVAAVKQMERDVAFVSERLHPIIASSIIREGLNPLDMHLDDVTSYINQFNEAYGVSDTDRIASYIARMDREQYLSEAERERLVAFYRVLNQIARDGSAALGLMYNSDTPLTLGNMLSAATYYQGGRLNATSDSTKGLSGIRATLSTQEPITESTTESTTETTLPVSNTTPPQAELDTLIAKDLAQKLEPHKLAEVLENIDESTPIEDIANNIQHDSATTLSASYAAAQAHFASVFSTPPKALHWLRTSGLGTTPTHMAGVSALLADQFYIGREVEKLRKRFEGEEPNEDTAELRNFVDGLDIDNMDQYSPEVAESAVRPFGELAHLLGAVRVKSAASKLHNGSDYSYPIRLHGGIATLNMFVVNPDMDALGARALIALNTSSLGDISAHATLERGRVSLHIGASTPSGISKLQKQSELLSNMLQEAGFEVSSISFADTPEPPLNALDNALEPRPREI